MKQAILVRTDLKMTKGKIAAQAAHASVEATLKSDKTVVSSWRREGMKKIVLKIKDKAELYKYIEAAKMEGLTTSVITDAGHTQLEPGTVSCGAIGPAKDTEVDKITASLTLFP
jgi:peptidyl-tRNA hydrolase, PTH2 family